ncbi:MAG: hypothetical protein AB1724_04810 [Thermodesulfobacteriota bacterium]
MGKKSLFQPTGGSGKAKKEVGAKKAAGKKKAAAAKKAVEAKKAPAPKKAAGKKTAIKAAPALPPETVVSPAEESRLPAPEPEKEMTPQAPETTPSAVEPSPQKDIVDETPAVPAVVQESAGDIVAEAPAPVTEAESGLTEANPPVTETSVSEEATAAEPVPETAVAPAEDAGPPETEPDMTAPVQAAVETVADPEPLKETTAEASAEAVPVATAEPVVAEAGPAETEVGASADAGGAEPESTPVSVSAPAPEKETLVAAAPAAVDPEPEKETVAPVREPEAIEIPESDRRCFETAVPALEPDVAPFENDPLIGGKSIVSAIAGLCVLIMILFISSASNSGRYYIKESKGAVKVWKGTFSPAGKERIMILPGAHWTGPLRASYSQEEVFSFAARYYLEKALSLTEDPASKDFDRMTYYLGRAGEMVADGESREAAAVISQAKERIAEVQTLQSSGERTAAALAREKLNAVGQALTALVTGLTENGGEPVGGGAGH